MLRIAKRKEAKLAAALAAAGLVLTPAFAATGGKKRAPVVSVSFDPMSSFTPANADPKLAAALAGKGLSLTDFKFTPAPAKGRPSQVRVAIRARTATPQANLADAKAATAAVNALAPTSYNLGVAIGWRRFAVSGDVAKVKDADPAVGAERTAGDPLPALRRGDKYSVDVGGSYSLSKRVALTGGVRYNIERDRMSALQDDRRDSQAVYVGTAFKF